MELHEQAWEASAGRSHANQVERRENGMNKTLSIRRDTNAQEIFSYLDRISRARNLSQRQSASVVPDPPIRARIIDGATELYVSRLKTGSRKTIGSSSSASKRLNRLRCAEIMIDVAKKFAARHQLENDRKVRTALAEIKSAERHVMSHDIKAGEMRALLETILKRPAELTIGTVRPSLPMTAQVEPEREKSHPAAERRAIAQASPAKKKTPRLRVKNFTRPRKALTQKKTGIARNAMDDADVIPPMRLFAPEPGKRVASMSRAGEADIFSDERRPLLDSSSTSSTAETNAPASLPTPMPSPQNSSTAASMPAKPRNGFLAFFSWIIQGVTNFFRSRFG